MSGKLAVVATPIGNLDDLSPRAAAVIAEADAIACEDTRVARVLLKRVEKLAGEVRGRLVRLDAATEAARVAELSTLVARGATVALTTDAGTPGVSDPGARLIAACADAGLVVEVVPGPSAVIAALVSSGLPTARFAFDGFLPHTRSERRKRLTALRTERRTVVLFEAPHRLAASLDDAAEILGDRRAAVARELTKVHEEIVRGTLPELAGAFADERVRGEVTLVIEGAPAVKVKADPAALVRQVRARVRRGETKRDAIAEVARERGVSRRTVYQAVLDAEG